MVNATLIFSVISVYFTSLCTILIPIPWFVPDVNVIRRALISDEAWSTSGGPVNAIVPAIWAGLNDVTGRDTRLGALIATTMPPTISEAVFSTIARSQVASRPSLPPAPSPPMHPPLESSPLVASSDHVPIDPQQPAKHGIVEIILRISAISSVVLFIKARLPSVLSHMIMSSAEKWAKGLATKGGLWLAKGLGWKKPALQEKPEAALLEVVAMVLKAIDTQRSLAMNPTQQPGLQIPQIATYIASNTAPAQIIFTFPTTFHITLPPQTDSAA